MPAGLDVLADADLEVGLAGRVRSLCPDLALDGPGSDGRVLVVGADVTWRRRVNLILEARGVRVAEAAHAEDAFSVARRVPFRGVVADLLLPDPGIADLLTRMEAEESMCRVPVLLVGPGALSPGQQRDLRHALVRWSRDRPVSVSELAGAVAGVVADDTRAPVGGATAGEATWRAH